MTRLEKIRKELLEESLKKLSKKSTLKSKQKNRWTWEKNNEKKFEILLMIKKQRKDKE